MHTVTYQQTYGTLSALEEYAADADIDLRATIALALDELCDHGQALPRYLDTPVLLTIDDTIRQLLGDLHTLATAPDTTLDEHLRYTRTREILARAGVASRSALNRS